MVRSLDKLLPVGEWLHSHEEDDENNMVFRKRDFAFPASRGRIGFKLAQGGGAQTLSIGADDRPIENTARWKLKENREVVIEGGDFEDLLSNGQLIMLESGRMSLRRRQTET